MLVVSCTHPQTMSTKAIIPNPITTPTYHCNKTVIPNTRTASHYNNPPPLHLHNVPWTRHPPKTAYLSSESHPCQSKITNSSSVAHRAVRTIHFIYGTPTNHFISSHRFDAFVHTTQSFGRRFFRYSLAV